MLDLIHLISSAVNLKVISDGDLDEFSRKNDFVLSWVCSHVCHNSSGTSAAFRRGI